MQASSGATGANLDRSRRAPETETEQVVAGIWSRVLNAAKLEIDDDFFHLGGNSLLAVQIAFEIQKAFQVQVPLQMIFNAPTIC